MRLQRSQVTWSQLRVGIFSLICGVVLLWLALFAANGPKSSPKSLYCTNRY